MIENGGGTSGCGDRADSWELGHGHLSQSHEETTSRKMPQEGNDAPDPIIVETPVTQCEPERQVIIQNTAESSTLAVDNSEDPSDGPRSRKRRAALHL